MVVDGVSEVAGNVRGRASHQLFAQAREGCKEFCREEGGECTRERMGGAA